MTTNEIINLLSNAKPQGAGWLAHCPGHEDNRASLSISTGDDGRTLLKCHAGCSPDAICEAIGIKISDLYVRTVKQKAKIAATYNYVKQGVLQFQSVRMQAKDFRLRRPDGGGDWIWNMKGVDSFLYNYDRIRDHPDRAVFVPEGEKDADNLTALDFVATTNPMGAGKWRKKYNDILSDRRIVILPDNDSAGRDHAHEVAASLWGKATEIRIVELPNLPPKGDVSDWLGAGGTKEQFLALVKGTRPLTQDDVDKFTPVTDRPDRGILRFPFTDAGSAELFADIYGDRFVFNHDEGKWLIYDGDRWNKKTGNAQVRMEVVRLARQIRAEALTAENNERREAIEKYARSLESSARISNVLREAQGYLARYTSDFDGNPALLNVANGTIDLRSGELQPHAAGDMITKLAPVVYDPDATHPTWTKFLHDSTNGDEPLAVFLQVAVGYTLTGFTDEEKFFLIHGAEATGKSTFLETIKAVLGDYAQTADFDTFLQRRAVGGVRNDIARLVGARFVPSIEVDEGKKLAEGLVKTVTGGDTITARFLYREAFEFQPEFKLWLACNHAPRIKESDGGMWRRILRVPFEHTVPEDDRDPKVKATLKNVQEGGPAVLAWAVQGCLRWQLDGLVVPPRVATATTEYRSEQDPLREFLEDTCKFDEDAYVPVAEFRKAYEGWAGDVGVKYTLGARAFNERLEARGCRRITKKYVNDIGTHKIGKCWTGIKLECNQEIEDEIEDEVEEYSDEIPF